MGRANLQQVPDHFGVTGELNDIALVGISEFGCSQVLIRDLAC
jgi:hypothetical protein